ncbi:cytochrome b561 domain-containing protein [Thalassococcus lentus]|uniref:Cytochrome b561 domain-containing protein n=1 Tax=Thalassococcus lentus TaxID=1210524 RepID=A0ABT4XQ52_9RHOB|nr:cytochrome b561 domain-containing protein [Thalassococcus lentus]MDA7424079.1 cytochrome b561 domain-containing protein [Thalassococcus lentus]
MDWLLAPFDPARAHEVGFAISWHARVMTLAWGVLAPLAVIAARFFKVLPGQDWPKELDNQVWWRSHWMGQVGVVLLSVLGLALVLGSATGDGMHGRVGYAVLGLLVIQVVLGVFRGTKGGPTAPAEDGSLRGDHYDMTPWRIMFEWSHKILGYAAVLLGMTAIVLGLWQANAPNWMWLTIAAWWLALFVSFVILQRRGRAVDTYQAIWGPDPSHPGNRRVPIGWGIRRMRQGGKHVRGD